MSLHKRCTREEFVAKCQRAAELGFDVLAVPDHLWMPSPFPATLLAAEASDKVKVGTFVLNSGFWNGSILAREIATAQLMTGGRFELGLGAGYVEAEYQQAGIPFPSRSGRVENLRRAIEVARSDESTPGALPKPPLLVAGRRDRTLRLAARYADIVGLSVLADEPGTLRAITAEELDDRVAKVRAGAGSRFASLELNLMIHHVHPTENRAAAAEDLKAIAPAMSGEQRLEAPAGLIGTTAQMAEILRERRQRWGVTYISVHEQYMEALAPVIAEVK
ncbi:LLM class F420-dependent oxidoreductase [Lentzea sp. NBRC 105346]|uniref:TIGR03621 family F420-dependent LLM class oxidoreductase n=1 Tax=Lentzea sp. NBRC 105346 TaxID=3032205 RepID=UPI0024A2E897|nr:TIGR03621 family F420-dependent LLM class oxidoreductase [Lentzea sp. NBRC 105346]GLZ29234.1 LLM class F420-dependent oxidoreductase [Lentzea sp. NBRC 105346]